MAPAAVCGRRDLPVVLVLCNYFIIADNADLVYDIEYTLYDFEGLLMKDTIAKLKNDFPLELVLTAEGFIPELSQPLEKEQLPFPEWKTDRWAALYHFGLGERPEGLSPSALYLYTVTEAFFRALTSLPELELAREKAQVRLSDEEAVQLLRAVPFAAGSEYIDRPWLERAFEQLNQVFSREIAAYDGTAAFYLAEQNQRLRVPERIFFHLVESRDEDFPFAFLATYATRGENGRITHVPLRYALTEYGGDRDKLLELLACLNRAAELSPLIGEFMETGELFHPLRLTVEEAYTLLKQAEDFEQAGILCRVPNWWRKRNAAVTLSVSLGGKKPSLLGFDTLVSVQPELAVDGVPLTREEVQTLLAQTEGLALLKGKWVEVDHKRLRALLEQMESLPEMVTLMDALRMELDKPKADVGMTVTNGDWLGGLLNRLRSPGSIPTPALPESFHAVLRPYQQAGFTWLNYMDSLGFGACLADDMGLGKTVQVLGYLERLRTERQSARALLVVPATLLGNWGKEIERFTPEMDTLILHGKTSAALEQLLAEETAFLTVTTYGMAARIKGLQAITWDCVILDEAQAIKNPLTKQTREVKKLSAHMRVAMTGTPVENDLTNLWSLFDFLNKGLLGTSKEFKGFCSQLSEKPEGYARLRAMTAPFMLRRVKTDKKIIADLPEKLEMAEHVTLSKKQAVLYRKAVADMEHRLVDAEGIGRKGLVLATITKLKQICNHPDQYLGQQGFEEKDSGKLGVLRELCETIRDKRERVLVFTQFRELTGPLAAFLTDIFHIRGYVLHGGTPVKKRGEIVAAFQGEEYVPFIVLSLKAGGTGLNLTKASHVIHFDRWWNPAVENQATDRAFRIGQTKNVMVHKLVCDGTIEEKIDEMIAAKQGLAEQVLSGGGEKWLTELSNAELLSVLRLDGREDL